MRVVFFCEIMSITKVAFKDEGELNGEPIGPITLTVNDGLHVTCGWMRISQAYDLADTSGLTLEWS
jgi:hypothetical protein